MNSQTQVFTSRLSSRNKPVFIAAQIAFFSLAALPAAEATMPFNPNLVSDVAEKVTPAVVNITTRRTQKMGNRQRQHPLFRDFFGRKGRMPPQMGAGSGVVISANGQIVTNNHVVEGADVITVTFADGREYKAKLKGVDKSSDLAFLQIKAKKLPFLKFGDSASLRLGEFVLAVGNPFGVGQTVTMGIVSAKGRANVGIVDYEDFIQTDAAINPGNSGGALVNLKGELVGINTAILSRSGGAQGIGFAVPSNMVRPIKEQIAENGRVRRGWLGVAIQDLTPELARTMTIKSKRGVLISDVMEGGPAHKAKLNPGDVVIRVNDKVTRNAAQLRNRIALTKPGSKAKLSIVREGKEKDIYVTLAEKKPREAVARLNAGETQLVSGLAVRDLNSEIRKELRIPGRVNGVVVSHVEPDSPAERSGITQGTLITSVNKQKIRSPKEFAKAIPKDSKEVLLRVYRRGVFTYLILRK